jgi:hypothetical protein
MISTTAIVTPYQAQFSAYASDEDHHASDERPELRHMTQPPEASV